jgi:hypothetical protein
MKKLLLLVTSAAFSLSLSAQSLQWVNINPGLSVSGPNNETFDPYAQVKNISANDISVRVIRTVNNLANGHSSNFCFGGVCFLPGTDESPANLAVYVPAGQVADSVPGTLRADLNPLGFDGISEVTYCVYNVDDVSDSVCITFKYNAGPISVSELAKLKFLGNVHPNPADQNASVAYNLTYAKDAQIVISNLLGSAIAKVTLTEKAGTVALPIATLPEGVYYYTLMNDGKALVSKRLMITHR